jgi:hypothetical protein
MYLLIMLIGSNKDNLTVSYRLGFYSTQVVQVCQCLNRAMHIPVSGTHVLRQVRRSLTVLTSDLQRGRKCLSQAGSTAERHRMQKTQTMIITVHVASLFTCFLQYQYLTEETQVLEYELEVKITPSLNKTYVEYY